VGIQEVAERGWVWKEQMSGLAWVLGVDKEEGMKMEV
jgi:hypothetical protein